MNTADVATLISLKREQHPELARPLLWLGFLRICDRESIRVRLSAGRMPRLAQLVPYQGTWTIVLNRDAPPRRHTYLGAHELGHLWLHHDARHERWERVYNMSTEWVAGDPREDDAEIFASLVLMGPRKSRPYTIPPERETALQFALRTMRVRRGPR